MVSIASIRGRARGHGSEFALACDLRFASLENAILGQPEVGVGVLPGGGALEWLPALVGRSRALEIVLGADDYDAGTCDRCGWINRALPDAELDGFVDGFAGRIAGFSRPALIAAKEAINAAATTADPHAIASAQRTFRALAVTPDTAARIGAILQKGLQQPGDVELRLGAHVAELCGPLTD